MTTRTIDTGQQLTKDPSDVRVYTVDWDDHLATAVTITSQTTAASAIKPSTASALTVTTTGAGLGIQSLSRSVKLKASDGQDGALYRVTQTVVTNETPAQTIERSFDVWVENL